MSIPGIKLKDKKKKTPSRVGFTGKEGSGKSSIARLLKGKKLICDMEAKLPLEVLQDPDCHVVEFDGEPTFDKTIDMLKGLYKADKLPVEWLVIDTFTMIEKVIHKMVINRDFDGSRKDFSAFATGYRASYPECDRFLDLLTRIEHKHGLNTCLLLHASTKSAKNIFGDDFPKLEISLTDGMRDSVLRFLHYNGVIFDKPSVTSGKMNKKVTSQERMISFDNKSPYFNAKSMRQDIPMEVPFDIDGKWINLTINKEIK